MAKVNNPNPILL